MKGVAHASFCSAGKQYGIEEQNRPVLSNRLQYKTYHRKTPAPKHSFLFLHAPLFIKIPK